jgi:hypothetical protein
MTVYWAGPYAEQIEAMKRNRPPTPDSRGWSDTKFAQWAAENVADHQRESGGSGTPRPRTQPRVVPVQDHRVIPSLKDVLIAYEDYRLGRISYEEYRRRTARHEPTDYAKLKRESLEKIREMHRLIESTPRPSMDVGL